MKKFIVMLAMAASAMAVSAQETTVPNGYYANKFTDNWYIGVDAGVMSKTTHQAVLKNVNPNVGLRLGKWLTPSVGFALEGNALFGNKVCGENYTDAKGIKAYQAMLLTQFNLSNIFGGYPGQPRAFEVIGNLGIGIQHNYGSPEGIRTIQNTLNQKIAVDFAWNFGDDKQWQFYVEPAISYGIAGAKSEYTDEFGHLVSLDAKGRQLVNYDINYSILQLNVGVNYKFKTSNGHHNFTIVEACDQNQINALNDEVNQLRAKLATIPALLKEIEDLKKALEECQNRPVATVVEEKTFEPNLPAVFYQVNKAVVTPAQAQNVAIAAQVMKNHPELKLMIKGYASPEGGNDNNNTLSVKRADAVKDLLVNKYKIDASRITAEGCGATDKLFEIYEFNRVAMLYIEK